MVGRLTQVWIGAGLWLEHALYGLISLLWLGEMPRRDGDHSSPGRPVGLCSSMVEVVAVASKGGGNLVLLGIHAGLE